MRLSSDMMMVIKCNVHIKKMIINERVVEGKMRKLSYDEVERKRSNIKGKFISETK